MHVDPATPLQTLALQTLTGPGSINDNPAWLGLARQACEESLRRVNALLAMPEINDRDMHACLLAVGRSLQWAMTETASSSEMSITVRRALQVFDRMAAIPLADQHTLACSH